MPISFRLLVLVVCAVVPVARACAEAPSLVPPPVPYLNPPWRYVVGGGIAAATGNVAGDWSQLIGPGYSTDNLIDSERLTIGIDGKDEPLQFAMKRSTETGIYSDAITRGDLRIQLIDFAPWGQSWVGRLLVIDNLSKTAPHDVVIRAHVSPSTAKGMTNGLVGDKNPGAIFLRAGTTADSMFPGPNPFETSAVVTFAGPAATPVRAGKDLLLEAPHLHLAPGGSSGTLLVHYFHAGDHTDAQCIDAAKVIDGTHELVQCVRDWRKWFGDVPPAYRLSNIPDERARQLIEGALSVLKTNNSADGGFVACLTFFREGFWRDTALGLSGLNATGHFDELKRWLLWSNHVYQAHQHIPDCADCRPDLATDQVAFDMGNVGVEGPAYVLLVARDYLKSTDDLATLRSIDAMLRFCAEEQLRQADANNDRLEFNGDETEVCGVIDLTPAGGEMRVPAQAKEWSMSSIAICAASLDFFIQYVEKTGGNPSTYPSKIAGKTLDLHQELKGLISAMDRDYWRTNFPNIPGGFHDSFRRKDDNSWPKMPIANLTLMPAYFHTPYPNDEKVKDITAIAPYFDAKTEMLQLVCGGNTGSEGHDLGYLLSGLVDINDPRKDVVCHALLYGPTVDAWGSFNEAYDNQGKRNEHDLRTLETGVNLTALAHYYGLGSPAK